MEETNLHPELDQRLVDLAKEILELRDKGGRAQGVDKVEAMARVELLERRFELLQERLNLLKSQGGGFQQSVKREFEQLADQLAGAVADLISWTDSGFDSSRRPARPSGS